MDAVGFGFNQKGRKGLKDSKKLGSRINKKYRDHKAKLLVSKQRQGVCDISLVKSV